MIDIRLLPFLAVALFAMENLTMRWRNRARSRNVEDRRHQRGPGLNLGRLPIPRSRNGLIALLIMMGIIWALGGNPLSLLSGGGGGSVGIGKDARISQSTTIDDYDAAAFISTVLADTEKVWGDIFRSSGDTYQPPTLVLFRNSTTSGCGFASSATGPFYCPADEKIYIDLSFFDQLSRDLNAPGDFAQAYVLAHEVAHHVQHLLGTTDKVHGARKRVSESKYNRLSVKLELQADFLAGVWAHHAQARWRILEPGDIDEAIRAAGAIGDDRLQQQSKGYVVPDSFTHGTSAQRVRWFRKGFETGDVSQGDTFGARDL